MFVFLEPQAPFKWECLQEAYGSRKRNVFSDANVLFPSFLHVQIWIGNGAYFSNHRLLVNVFSCKPSLESMIGAFESCLNSNVN